MLMPPTYQILKLISERSAEDPLARMLERSLAHSKPTVSWSLLSYCLDSRVFGPEEGNQIASQLLGRRVDVEEIRSRHDRPRWRFWVRGGYRGAFQRYRLQNAGEFSAAAAIRRADNRE